MRRVMASVLVLALAIGPLGCGDDGDSEAEDRGVGEACVSTDECPNVEVSTGGDTAEEPLQLECLTEFRGGYCGLRDCTSDDECPEGSLCAMADNGTNYCFLTCGDKPDCNDHRDAQVESNCVSNLRPVDESRTEKVCVPPMGS